MTTEEQLASLVSRVDALESRRQNVPAQEQRILDYARELALLYQNVTIEGRSVIRHSPIDAAQYAEQRLLTAVRDLNTSPSVDPLAGPRT